MAVFRGDDWHIEADHVIDIFHRGNSFHHGAEEVRSGGSTIGTAHGIPNSNLVDIDALDGFDLGLDELFDLVGHHEANSGIRIAIGGFNE